MLAGGPLRLETGPESRATRFHFIVTVGRTSPRGDRLTTDFIVMRDGEHVAIVATAPNGLPYCYMTRGLYVGIDRSTPGGLRIFRGGAPVFELKAAEPEDHLIYSLKFSGKESNPLISLDLSSLLRAALNRMTAGEVIDERSLRLETDNASVVIRMPQHVTTRPTTSRAFAMPLESWALAGRHASTWLSIGQFGIDEPAPFEQLELTHDDVVQLGLPVRPIPERGLQPEDLFIPSNFPANTAEKRASQALLELLLKRVRPQLPHGPQASLSYE